jgi:hypothetical protein
MFTCGVEVAGGRIIGGAPIIKRFIGQKLGNLTKWIITKNNSVSVSRLTANAGESR